MTRNKTLFGNLFLLIAAVAWGLAFTTQKIAAAHLPPFSVNGIRFLIGGLFLIPVIFIFDSVSKSGRCLLSLHKPRKIDITRTELIGGILCGVVLLVAATLQQISLSSHHVGPGKASFLTALYVVFVPFYGLIRRKIAPFNVWISVAIAVLGAYLLTAGGIGSFSIGGYDVLLLVSASFFALHIVVIDIFVPRVDAVRMSMIQFLTAGILSLPLMFLADPHIASVPTGEDILAALPAMLFLGFVSTGIGYTAQVVGQQISATPTIASLIMSLESVVGLLGGVILLDEKLGGCQFLGCAVILFAVILSQLPVNRLIASVRQKKTAKKEASSKQEDNEKKETD